MKKITIKKTTKNSKSGVSIIVNKKTNNNHNNLTIDSNKSNSSNNNNSNSSNNSNSNSSNNNNSSNNSNIISDLECDNNENNILTTTDKKRMNKYKFCEEDNIPEHVIEKFNELTKGKKAAKNKNVNEFRCWRYYEKLELNNQYMDNKGFKILNLTDEFIRSMSIFNQYLYYEDYYQEKYGMNTVILMQVGDFYEIYGIETDDYIVGQLSVITQILQISKSNRSSNYVEDDVIDVTKYQMAGGPLNNLSSYVEKLVMNKYSVVVIDQIGNSTNKENKYEKLQRKVTAIYTLGTFSNFKSETESIEDSRYLLQIYIEGYQKLLINSSNINQEIRYDRSKQRRNYQPMTVGLSAIDVSTGENNVYEVSNSEIDYNFALDEIYRYIQTHKPIEIIISTNNIEMSEEDLEQYLDLKSNYNVRYNIQYNNVPKEYHLLSYQEDFFIKIYGNRGTMLNVIEYLGLEKSPCALKSFLILLQFTYDHDRKVLNNLKKPYIWFNNRYMLLANNAINQLNLLDNQSSKRDKFRSILGLLDMNTTVMGRRLFKYRLLNPLVNGKEINKRYDMIDEFRKQKKEIYLWKLTEHYLTNLIDLDKFNRRIELKQLEPVSLQLLRNSYDYVKTLLEILPNDLMNKIEIETNSILNITKSNENILSALNNFMRYLDERMNWEECINCTNSKDYKNNFFNYGYDKELDNLQENIQTYMKIMDNIINDLSRIHNNNGKKSEAVVMKYDINKNGHFISITAKRYNILLEELKKLEEINSEGYLFNYIGLNYKSNIKSSDFRIVRSNPKKTEHVITFHQLEDLSNKLIQDEQTIKNLLGPTYLKLLNEVCFNYDEVLRQIAVSISLIDYYKSCAKVSIKYNYCRPKVLSSLYKKKQNDMINNNDNCDNCDCDDECDNCDHYENDNDGDCDDECENDMENDEEKKLFKSFVRFKRMRHPLIERQTLNTSGTYVPHSFQIGNIDENILKEIDKEEWSSLPKYNGYLLYGINSGGKSSCMKAIGINLVMAQAGMYVACDEMIYEPYHKILTRILGNDDIHRGLSSFAVEMSELRGIFARADDTSIVLGDEVCNGTETISATALVTSALKRLISKSSHFIFATHLHQLMDIDEIKNLRDKDELGIYHIQVDYDNVEHKLIYGRQLVKGHGESIYGIEVAKAMDLDVEFIDDAQNIRRILVNEEKEVIPFKRSRYNKRLFIDNCEICGNKGQDTHHILFQCTADKDGFVDHFHMNNYNNLVVLCKQCHIKVHQYKYEIKGYKMTSDGLILDYTTKK